MARILFQLSFAILVIAVCLAFARTTQAAAEDLLAELNAKSPEQRQKILVENAKKEGEVTLYTAVNMRDAQELMTGFNRLYPGIRVAIASLGGPGVLNKVLTEARAGANVADVVALNGISAVELIDRKLVIRYKSPMIGFLRKGFVDADGYWPGIYAIGYTLIYNSRRVAAKDVPKRYEDLLQPRWKNNLIIDGEDHDLLAGLIDLWGEAKATSFLTQIAQEQKVTLSRQSHTFMTQLVATGEHDAIVDGYVHNAVALKEKGAPIDYVVLRSEER